MTLQSNVKGIYRYHGHARGVFLLFMLDWLPNGILLRQECFGMFSFIGLIPFVGYVLNKCFSRWRMLFYLFVPLLLCFALLAPLRQFGPSPKNLSYWINRQTGKNGAAVFVVRMRSVVAGQAYYLDDGIYLLPVDNELELREYLSKLSGKVDRVFIARYYFPSDPTLMDRAFLGVGNIGGGYRLHAEKSGDFMNVREFIR